MVTRRTHGVLVRAVAAGACIAAVLTGISATTAQAASDSLVALGDSYASGVSTRSYDRDSGSCYRSPYAYPALDAARLGLSLTFAACSGATTGSVRRGQLTSLGPDTDDVTLTVGGNDTGFVEVIATCALPRWVSNCHGAIDEARHKIRTMLPRRLDRLYSAIRSRAPGATVVVVGYPRLFMGEDCNAGTWFSRREQRRLNATADLLAETIRGRVAAAGFSYVDPRAAFTGHAVCDDVEWVNGLSYPLRESYHPNRSGQVAYADLVDDMLA